MGWIMDLFEGPALEAAPQEAAIWFSAPSQRWGKLHQQLCKAEKLCADWLGENGQHTILKYSVDCKQEGD